MNRYLNCISDGFACTLIDITTRTVLVRVYIKCKHLYPHRTFKTLDNEHLILVCLHIWCTSKQQPLHTTLIRSPRVVCFYNRSHKSSENKSFVINMVYQLKISQEEYGVAVSVKLSVVSKRRLNSNKRLTLILS